jgi:hypothetical protein
MCFARDARDRCTAAELLDHPFLALQGESKKARWVSPKSILDAAFWESESDEESEDEEEISGNAAKRIKSLACSVSAFPDWESGEGWIDVLGGEQFHEPRDSPATKEPGDVASRAPSKVFGCAAVPAEGVAVVSGLSSDEQLDAEEGPPFGGDILPDDRQNKVISNPDRDVLSFEIPCNRINGIEKFRFPRTFMSHFLINPLQFLLCAGPVLINVISLNFHACLGEKQHVCFALPFNHKGSHVKIYNGKSICNSHVNTRTKKCEFTSPN